MHGVAHSARARWAIPATHSVRQHSAAHHIADSLPDESPILSSIAHCRCLHATPPAFLCVVGAHIHRPAQASGQVSRSHNRVVLVDFLQWGAYRVRCDQARIATFPWLSCRQEHLSRNVGCREEGACSQPAGTCICMDWHLRTGGEFECKGEHGWQSVHRCTGRYAYGQFVLPGSFHSDDKV